MAKPNWRKWQESREIAGMNVLTGVDNNSVNQTDMDAKFMTSVNEKSHTCIRIGTLPYTGLEFVHFFEIPSGCISWHLLSGINPLLQMSFSFIQMYYIFMHHRLNINKKKVIAKLGLMHLIATNYCLLIRGILKESVRDIAES